MDLHALKILIINCVVMNGGDAAILLAIVRHVREIFGPNVSITVFDAHPDQANCSYPELANFLPDPKANIDRIRNRCLRKLSYSETIAASRAGVVRPLVRPRAALLIPSRFSSVINAVTSG